MSGTDSEPAAADESTNGVVLGRQLDDVAIQWQFKLSSKFNLYRNK